MNRLVQITVLLLLAAGVAVGAEVKSATLLLQEGIYAEETEGNLDKAIGIYQEAAKSAAATEKSAAEAVFRTGMCYLKKGDKTTAIKQFKLVLTKFASQTAIAEQAKKQLTGLGAGSRTEPAKPLEIGAVPWTDGEICKLSIKTNAGLPVGGIYYMPRLVKEGGKDVWQLDSFQFVTVQESRQFTRVEADPVTFAPSAGRTINQLGDFVAAYEPDKVTLAATIKGQVSTKEITVSGPVFDNEQAIMLIRRLPLTEGYSTRFQIFTVQGGTVIDCPIEVVGKEEVTVPFGTGPCWKVKLAVYSGAIKTLTLWFSADEHKRLMKYDAGTAVMELLEVSTVQPQMVVSESDSGVSFTLPTGWIAHIEAQNGGYKPYAQIANEGLETWACLSGSAATGTALNATVDGDITTLKGFFKDYTPRSDSRTTITVDGVPAVRYEADYAADGKAMVESRTYLIKNGTVYWFVFRIEKDKFEANKAIYDGIVSSFAVADK